MGQSLGDVLRPPKHGKERMKKSGANFIDRNHIKRLMAGGKTAEEISNGLLIHQSSIESWMAHFSPPAPEPVDPGPVSESEPEITPEVVDTESTTSRKRRKQVAM